MVNRKYYVKMFVSLQYRIWFKYYFYSNLRDIWKSKRDKYFNRKLKTISLRESSLIFLAGNQMFLSTARRIKGELGSFVTTQISREPDLDFYFRVIKYG